MNAHMRDAARETASGSIRALVSEDIDVSALATACNFLLGDMRGHVNGLAEAITRGCGRDPRAASHSSLSMGNRAATSATAQAPSSSNTHKTPRGYTKRTANRLSASRA